MLGVNLSYFIYIDYSYLLVSPSNVWSDNSYYIIGVHGDGYIIGADFGLRNEGGVRFLRIMLIMYIGRGRIGIDELDIPNEYFINADVLCKILSASSLHIGSFAMMQIDDDGAIGGNWTKYDGGVQKASQYYILL